MYRIHRAVHWASLDAYIRSLGPAGWWLKGQGQTVTGSGVSQWDDLSGNGRHLLQGTDAARPALQADGSVLFNGTSHYLKTNAFTLNQPEWVLWVGKQVSWTGVDRVFDGNADVSGVLYQSPTTPRLRLYAGVGSTENANLAVGALGVVSCVINGASSALQINNTAATGGDPGAANMGGLTLGAAATGASNWANISTSELLVFPFAPSTAQLDRLVAGLMARHGVA